MTLQSTVGTLEGQKNAADELVQAREQQLEAAEAQHEQAKQEADTVQHLLRGQITMLESEKASRLRHFAATWSDIQVGSASQLLLKKCSVVWGRGQQGWGGAVHPVAGLHWVVATSMGIAQGSCQPSSIYMGMVHQGIKWLDP